LIKLIKATARADRDAIAQFSSQGQSALHLVGGLYKLGMATEEELRWLNTVNLQRLPLE